MTHFIVVLTLLSFDQLMLLQMSHFRKEMHASLARYPLS